MSSIGCIQIDCLLQGKILIVPRKPLFGPSYGKHSTQEIFCNPGMRVFHFQQIVNKPINNLVTNLKLNS